LGDENVLTNVRVAWRADREIIVWLQITQTALRASWVDDGGRGLDQMETAISACILLMGQVCELTFFSRFVFYKRQSYG
jgi:hypothetical protein